MATVWNLRKGVVAPTVLGRNPQKIRLDFTKWRDWARDAGTAAPAAGDTVQFLDMPAGARVRLLGYEIEVADAAVTDFNIGDNAAANTWVEAGSAAALAFADSLGLLATGKLFTAADILDLLLVVGDPTTLVMTITVDAIGYHADS